MPLYFVFPTELSKNSGVRTDSKKNQCVLNEVLLLFFFSWLSPNGGIGSSPPPLIIRAARSRNFVAHLQEPDIGVLIVIKMWDSRQYSFSEWNNLAVKFLVALKVAFIRLGLRRHRFFVDNDEPSLDGCLLWFHVFHRDLRTVWPRGGAWVPLASDDLFIGHGIEIECM